MAIEFRTPTQVYERYRQTLKLLKPEVNVDQTDSDWYIRGRVFSGVVAGLWADQQAIAGDAFPQRAREEAILRFLETYFEGGYTPATQAQGPVMVSGTPGTTVPQLTEFLYAPNGNTYQTQEAVVLAAATGLVNVLSVSTGQQQNLAAGSSLSLPSPPPGIDGTALVATGGLSDARNRETLEQARARVLDRIREPLSVGRESDYRQYALAADPAVVTASVIRYPFGLGTVGIFITSGTTDIDAAVDADEPIIITPSDELVERVQDALEENSILTDCVTVLKPAIIPIDITVRVRFAQGDKDTILSGQTVSQGQLVIREIRRATYKTPVGGRRLGSFGYLVASDIEETIDVGLSDEPVTIGSLPILLDRQVLDLSATGANRRLLPGEAPEPGTITILEDT